MLEFKIKLTKCSGQPISQFWSPVDGSLSLDNVSEILQNELYGIVSYREVPGWDMYSDRHQEILEDALFKALEDLGYNYYPDGDYKLDVDDPWDDTISSSPGIDCYDKYDNHKHFVCIEFLPSKSFPEGLV